MPIASSVRSALVLSDLIYIVGIGGREVLRFDPLSNAWSTMHRTLRNRENGASFVLGNFLYAAGGTSQLATGGGSQYSSVERYDVASDSWTAVADMVEGRTFFGAVTVGPMRPPEEPDLFDSLIVKASKRRS
jgi:N-acetylneuraminic acid mutarotase